MLKCQISDNLGSQRITVKSTCCHLFCLWSIKNMKTSKSSGLDEISSKLLVLTNAGNSIIESLLYLFNLVLNTGIFPDDMKLATVTPIYKSGAKTYSLQTHFRIISCRTNSGENYL